MRTVAAFLMIATAGVCAWLVADGDRARLQVWAERWTAGAINHVDHYREWNAELRGRIDRMKAEADDLRHYIATLEDNLAYQIQIGRRQERDLARHPKVIVAHCPRIPRPHCLDHIANELNAVSALGLHDVWGDSHLTFPAVAAIRR